MNLLTNAIQDTGVGIKKENISKIFSNTQETSTIGTRGEKATGIWNAYCKKFVTQYDGFIEVSSVSKAIESSKSGTKFTLTFKNASSL